MTKIWYFLAIVVYLNMCNGQGLVHEEPINVQSNNEIESRYFDPQDPYDGCNICVKKSGMKCLSETKFTPCSEGNVETYNCPNGTVCTTSDKVCLPPIKVKHPIKKCNRGCGKCNVERRYACRSEGAFSLCFNKDAPGNDNVFPCPSNEFCSTILPSYNGKQCFPENFYNKKYADCTSGSKSHLG